MYGSEQDCSQLLQEMRSCGLQPGLYSYNTLLNRHAQRANAAAAHSLTRQMREVGVKPDRTTYNTLLKLSVQLHDVAGAYKVRSVLVYVCMYVCMYVCIYVYHHYCNYDVFYFIIICYTILHYTTIFFTILHYAIFFIVLHYTIGSRANASLVRYRRRRSDSIPTTASQQELKQLRR